MGWARGEVGGKEVGYAVRATCEHPGCTKQIDKGLAYACGGEHGETSWSCGGYFCDYHLKDGWAFNDAKRMVRVCRKCNDPTIE